jgi:Flp pilus assembly protein TadG
MLVDTAVRAMTALRRPVRGAAALEFGLLVPIFMIILAGGVDLGNAVLGGMLTNAAVSAGSNFAMVNATNVSSTAGATLASNIATIVANSNGTGWANSSVTVNNGPTASMTSGVLSTGGTPANADSCYCPTGTATSPTWGTAVACGNSCVGGGLAGKFVVVSATYSYTPLIKGYSFAPSGNITAAMIAQTQ